MPSKSYAFVTLGVVYYTKQWIYKPKRRVNNEEA